LISVLAYFAVRGIPNDDDGLQQVLEEEHVSEGRRREQYTTIGRMPQLRQLLQVLVGTHHIPQHRPTN